MKSSQRGTALVVALILLAIMTLVAAAGATTSTLELRMAAGRRNAVSAFQVADNAIETALECRRPEKGAVVRAQDCPAVPATPEVSYDFTVRRESGPGGVIPEGVSLGVEFAAVEYTVTSQATSGRGAQVQLQQGFYEIGYSE